MRFPPFLVLLLAACTSDYEVNVNRGEGGDMPEQVVVPDMVTQALIGGVPPIVPGASEEPSDEEDLDDEPSCWFGERTGAYVDTDGDGHLDSIQEVGVKTIPVFTLLSPANVTVAPGEDVVLEFSVASYNACGDMDFHMFFFGLYDFTDSSYEWLKPLNDDAVPSNFEDTEHGVAFPAYAAQNMRVTPTGNQLFYVWHDEESNGGGYGELIETQRVEETGERFYRFTWTASEYAPLDRTFQISLTQVGWTDVTTSAEIYYDYAPHEQGIEINVTVAE